MGVEQAEVMHAEDLSEKASVRRPAQWRRPSPAVIVLTVISVTAVALAIFTVATRNQGASPSQVTQTRDSARSEGFADGRAAGLSEGRAVAETSLASKHSEELAQISASAHAAGEEEGRNAGYSVGQADGYAAGQSEGQVAGYSAGYAAGTDAGYANGYSAGKSEGYALGYSAGQDAGYDRYVYCQTHSISIYC